MDAAIILAAVASILIILWVKKTFLHRFKYKLPPGPLLGYMGIINHLTLLNHREKYGAVSYCNVLGTDVIILNTPDAIKEAFKGETADALSERPETFLKNYIVYQDVAMRSMSEKNWKVHRQLLHSLLRQYGEGKMELDRVVSEELEVVNSLLKKTDGKDADIGEYLESSLINILNILLFAQRYDYHDKELRDTREALHLVNYISQPFIDGILNAIPILRFLPFGIGTTFQRTIEIRNERLSYIMNRCRNHSDKEKTAIVYDFFHLKEANDWITDDVIRGSILDVFAAGFMTTKSSLCTFFLVMLHHPELQMRIQQEIDEVIGMRKPSMEDRQNMPYTQAAILELTRYSGSLALSVPHMCSRDINFRGYTIPKESIVIPNLFGVNHNEELWDKPWNFMPDRFLDDSGAVLPASDRKRQNLIPFGVGKRVCIGEVFAKTRLFLYITFILQEFTVKPADHLPPLDPRGYIPGLVVIPPNYKLRFELRQKIN